MFINACKFHYEVLMMSSCRLGSGFLKKNSLHSTRLNSATVRKW